MTSPINTALSADTLPLDSQFTRSPKSKAPLLSNASGPGMSQRLSESSLASFYNRKRDSGRDSGSGSGRSTPSSSMSRFGPSAQLGSASSSHIPSGRSTPARTAQPIYSAVGVAPGPVDFADDDDGKWDSLHDFTELEKKDLSTPFDISSWRGWANGLTLLALAAGFLMLFAGYPILDFYQKNRNSIGAGASGYNLGGINSTGQIPEIRGFATMIDSDTPTDAMTHVGLEGDTWNLVFSDEFNQDGRTFYDGDDPFFQAVDIHYWATGDFEWYDPSAVTTKDGHLVLTMTQEPIHDLNFKSGMVQSWNKLCFHKNAYVEVSVSLPGVSSVGGFWPGVWLMANLGRPGYGASTEGMWPYAYDACDIGTLKNQTLPDGSGPATTVDNNGNGGLSYLPGQRTSACTCAGEDHPGPSHDVGRYAAEIDIIEAQIVIEQATGQVSQSYQLAPFDAGYQFSNTTAGAYKIHDSSITAFNSYLGGTFQQSASALTMIDDEIYIDQNTIDPNSGSGEFRVFGMEYKSKPDDRPNAYIRWISQGRDSWTLWGKGLAANAEAQISERIISEEPMALVFNFGASNNFQNVDFGHLIMPNYVRIDYVRVYQAEGGVVGCDPEDKPTADYIQKHYNAYTNPNLTLWSDAGYTFPKNSLIDSC